LLCRKGNDKKKHNELLTTISFGLEIFSLAQTNAKILWVAASINTFALARGVGLDLAELESDSSTGAIATEIFANLLIIINNEPKIVVLMKENVMPRKMCYEKESAKLKYLALGTLTTLGGA
jgi:hypothetical protein